MKHLNKIFAAALMVFGLSSQAQDSDNPWAITFGANAVDTQASATFDGDFASRFNKPFKVKDNWNILPSVSYLTVSRSVGNNFSVGVTGSVNKITKVVNQLTEGGEYIVTNPGDLTYYAADANIRYSLMSLIGSKVIDPSAHIGGGYTWFGDESAGSLNGGLGLTLWFTETVGLSLQSTYKKTFGEDKATTGVRSHVQHFAGLTFKFGGKDTDGDGIYDKDDACPEVFGPKELNGCPDTDGDTVLDKDDTCPEVAGLVEFQGCPDTDGDGVQDSADACVDVPGLKEFQGCPDTDGDGVQDKSDKCPTVKGPKENGGCPWPDTDGDGVLDKDDACPTVPGLAQYQGCPKPASAYAEEATGALTNILFDFNKATVRAESAGKIEQAATILNSAKDATFLVTGYTDAKGAEAYNLKLSRQRAAAVVAALEAKGVSTTQLKSVGVGERDAKVSEKASDAERQADRKVVVEAVNGAAWDALQKSDLPVVEKKVVKKKATKKRK